MALTELYALYSDRARSSTNDGARCFRTLLEVVNQITEVLRCMAWIEIFIDKSLSHMS